MLKDKRSQNWWETKEWRDTKREVFYRDNYHCVRCYKRFGSGYLTCHHLMPKNKGGSDSIENLVSLCYDCHNIAEIYELQTRVDIIGSMPDPPPIRSEWIEALLREQENLLSIGDGMAKYGIIFEDNHHCLRCGVLSGALAKFLMTYDIEATSVSGFAYLCQSCFLEIRTRPPQSILEIIPPPKRNSIRNDHSPYIEVVDSDYFELFQRPAWLKRQD